MVRQNSCLMSVPSASAESQLPASWSPHYSCTDASTMVPGYMGRLWMQDTQPQFWSKFQVWEWLQQTLDMHQIDASSIPFQNFDMDGRQLCSLSFQDFTRAAGTVGPLLYQSLTDLKWGSTAGQYGTEMFTPLDIKTEVEEFSCSMLPFKDDSYFYNSLPTDLLDGKPSFPTSGASSSPNPSGPDSKKQHSRPPTTQVKRHNPRGTHLWEFIRDILLNPDRNPGLIKWEDRAEGVFRFLKSEAVAQLWGKKKNNSSMTYEKLSRAMRYYYKREILERVDGRRLVYKFGRNARGWKESDK
ncbi:ETS homologous factor [Paramormyrops kingsleyae]|uniref:ETS homologous factor n=1 Tax=Paramormyrops kingsleyae TaxID=1676925 RepID=A0A3B3QHW0_9TELE|nr:ETS homologous factor [Paramormyrops kingsleyae]